MMLSSFSEDLVSMLKVLSVRPLKIFKCFGIKNFPLHAYYNHRANNIHTNDSCSQVDFHIYVAHYKNFIQYLLIVYYKSIVPKF